MTPNISYNYRDVIYGKPPGAKILVPSELSQEQNAIIMLQLSLTQEITGLSFDLRQIYYWIPKYIQSSRYVLPDTTIYLKMSIVGVFIPVASEDVKTVSRWQEYLASGNFDVEKLKDESSVPNVTCEYHGF